MAVTYQSVLDELNGFTLSNATDREDAIQRVTEFMDLIRPKIDQVLRENPNMPVEQTRAFDIAEKRIFEEVDTQFPNANDAGEGGRRRRRRSKKTRKQRRASRKSRKYRR